MVVAAKKGCHKKIKTIYDIFFTPSPQKKNSLEELLLHLPKNWITTNYSQAKSKLWPNISKLLTNCEKAVAKGKMSAVTKIKLSLTSASNNTNKILSYYHSFHLSGCRYAFWPSTLTVSFPLSPFSLSIILIIIVFHSPRYYHFQVLSPPGSRE